MKLKYEDMMQRHEPRDVEFEVLLTVLYELISYFSSQVKSIHKQQTNHTRHAAARYRMCSPERASTRVVGKRVAGARVGRTRR